MTENKRVFLVTGSIAVLAVGLTILATVVLYDRSLDRQRTRLTDLAMGQARLIEGTAGLATASVNDSRQSPPGTVLSRLQETYGQIPGFGQSGEVGLAQAANDQINWISRRRFDAGNPPKSEPLSGKERSPMAAALSGRSGTLVDLDYRGVKVLTAHQPIGLLNLGLITKIDLAEIQSPFILAGWVYSMIALLATFGGVYFAQRGANRVLKRTTETVNQLKKSSDQQKARVEEQTAELTSELTMREMIQKSLVEAKREADAANHSKSEFLANMSHELRTPLNSIIGFSEVLKEEMFGTLGNPKYKDYAGDINRSGSHLLQLINEVLDVAKIEAGALSLNEETFDLRLIVEESVAMVAERARQQELQITSAVPDHLPYLIADPLRVKQMVINLLTNSIKFTAPGGHLHIAVNGHLDAGMEVEVVDNGVGIAEEDLQKVLEPFCQGGRQSTPRVDEGTGLGLPLINMLIELHGGTMKLTSTKGTGTQVLLRFPKNRVVRRPNA